MNKTKEELILDAKSEIQRIYMRLGDIQRNLSKVEEIIWELEKMVNKVETI